MDTSDDATLVRYLLGDLPPEDTEKLDERSVVDAAFAGRLRGLEHDLADAYVRGELPPADRRRWERTFGVSDAGRAQLRLAEALAAREGRNAKTGKLIGPGRFGTARSRQSARLPIIGLLAASLAIAVGLGYSIHWQSPAPASIMPPAANGTANNGTAVTPSAATPSSATPSAATPSPPRSVVAITLPIPTRGVAAAPTLTVPAGAGEARVSLRLAPDDFVRYTVDVRELATGRVIWQATDLSPVAQSGDRVLLCTVPANVLRAGRLAFELHGAAPRRSDVLGSYLLHIER